MVQPVLLNRILLTDELAPRVFLKRKPSFAEEENILRFLYTIIRQTESNLLTKVKPSRSTIQSNFQAFLGVMEFTFGPPFRQISSDLSAKATEIIAQAVQDGSLHKGRFLERQQLTFRSIRRMLVTDFDLFMKQPSTRSLFYSKNLMMIHLAVMLQSCLYARAGDIVRSQGYTADESTIINSVITA